MSEYIASGLKCIFINGTVLGVVSQDWKLDLALIELMLKIILLLLTIAFTAFQFYRAAKKKDSK
jgi:hypothetical protein